MKGNHQHLLPHVVATVRQPAPSLTELRAQLSMDVQDGAEQAERCLAEAVTILAVQAYWEHLPTDGLHLRQPPPSDVRALTAGLQAVARRFGETAAALPAAEAAYHLSLLYTGLLPNPWRAAHGVYYTPPVLAQRLLVQAEAAGIDWARARVLDPAAGAGAFLAPVALRMLRALGDCAPPIAIQSLNARLRGRELDPFSAWLGAVFIDTAALPWITAAGRRPEALIEVRDSLKESPAERFDLVIGNPPFGRVTLDPQQRVRFTRGLFGHANQYGLFLDLAVELARPGGLISFLTPSSFLAGEYFKNLRALLSREAPPVAIDFVAQRKGVFEGVLQETVLATYRKGGAPRPVAVSFIQSQADGVARATPAGTCSLPAQPSTPWLLPRHASETRLAQRLSVMSARLVDWGYRVSTGPLVWNRFKSQLCDQPAPGTAPLIWAECIGTDGRFVFRSQKRNHKPYFRVTADDQGLLVRSACVLLQRTTAKEQTRRLIAAEMPETFVAQHQGVMVENHLNMLVPLSDKPTVPSALLAGFLNTMAADRAFRCLSGSVAVSAYELENLPLPDPAELLRWSAGYTGARFEEHVGALYRLSGKA